MEIAYSDLPDPCPVHDCQCPKEDHILITHGAGLHHQIGVQEQSEDLAWVNCKVALKPIKTLCGVWIEESKTFRVCHVATSGGYCPLNEYSAERMEATPGPIP